LTALEIAIAFTTCHGAKRAHPTVDFITPALVQDALARALFGASKNAANHHGVRAGCQSLDDIARKFDTAIGDDVDAILLGHPCTLRDCRQLRHTDASDHAC